MIEECLVVEFRVHGDDCPLADATRELGGVVDARPPQLRSDGNALLRFSSASPGLADALDADDRIRYLHASRGDRDEYRCLSKHPCVVHELVDAGLLMDSLRYRNGEARITGAVVGHDVLRGVLDTAGDTVGVTLERAYPLRDDDESPVADRWGLTPAQEAAIQAAHDAGYFQVPRDATATEVAETLDISKSAFLERLRRGQERLLGQVL